MSSSQSRYEAIKAVVAAPQTETSYDHNNTLHASEVYGQNVFCLGEMQARLPKHVFKSLRETINTGSKLDVSIADTVAAGMAQWAIERGATHYAHVFYPLTGFTAEKHDSFLEPDGVAGAVWEFGGEQLIQGEPDASSFPNGGIRDTYEARGYTAWDVTSPAYLLENENGITLCIPTAFVSFTGEALDKKTPVLRSMKAIDTAAKKVLSLFGTEIDGTITPTAGPEQEYFLIDANFYYSRPDLVASGRTVFGKGPGKGQEFSDHYFGAIPDRVLACMQDAEREMHLLGIPAKTRHNEVAPGQFEIAPVFEDGNIACDHQQLIMTTLKRVATKHGLVCLLQEKPFADLNGSGKHLNYSLGGPGVGNLLNPGETPEDNAQFLVFSAAIIRAVYKHQGLLRATVASWGNDFRLGGHEAPPAIISIFLGDQLNDVFQQIVDNNRTSSRKSGTLKIGVDTLPTLPKHAGDRNRTSPFAFVGNRFEFRALGSAQSIGGPLTALNTIIAESLEELANAIKAELKKTKDLGEAIQKVLSEELKEAYCVVFNGDGYSSEWVKEAKKRGLKELTSTIEALPEITAASTIATFKKYKVLSKRELASRQEIYLEQYAMCANVEATVALQIARTQILPAAIRYAGEIADSVNKASSVGIKLNVATLSDISNLVEQLQAGIDDLTAAQIKLDSGTTLRQATAARKEVLPALFALRKTVDTLETIIADDKWPLPTYQEMLFIK